MKYLNLFILLVVSFLSMNSICGFDVISSTEIYFKKMYFSPVEERVNYSKDNWHAGKENNSCKAIDGPGVGKPCIFPFTYRGHVYNTCTADHPYDDHFIWCSTKLDGNGEHVSGTWGICSLGCPGTEHERKCDTEEQGIQCTFPFSFMGFSYKGCIKRPWQDKHWCVVKDEMATTAKRFRRVNCSESCPTENMLTNVTLSPKEITEKLKTNTDAFTAIHRGGNCEDYLASYNMTKVRKTERTF